MPSQLSFCCRSWAEALLKSQNHRMGQKGTTVGHLVPSPCSDRVIPENTARDSLQTVLKYLQWGRYPHPLWTICYSAWSLRSKEFSLIFRWNSLHISFCPLRLALLLSTTEHSLFPPLTPPCRHWQTLMSFPLSVSFPGWTGPAASGSPQKWGASVPSSSFSHSLIIGLHVPQGTAGSQISCCPPGPQSCSPASWLPALSLEI